MSKMELLFRIKDENGCSNMGGIAIDSNGTLYCVKSKQGDSLQCLYVINNYRSAEIKKEVVTPSYTYMYGWLGHANSLTLSDGFLYVGTDKNYIIKLSASKLSTGRYSFLPRRVPSISKNKIFLSIIDNYSYFGKNWQEGNVLTFKVEGRNTIKRDLSKNNFIKSVLLIHPPRLLSRRRWLKVKSRAFGIIRFCSIRAPVN